jgi:hypothetical protein
MIQQRRDGFPRHVRRDAAGPRRRMNRIIPNEIVLDPGGPPFCGGMATPGRPARHSNS